MDVIFDRYHVLYLFSAHCSLIITCCFIVYLGRKLLPYTVFLSLKSSDKYLNYCWIDPIVRELFYIYLLPKIITTIITIVFGHFNSLEMTFLSIFVIPSVLATFNTPLLSNKTSTISVIILLLINFVDVYYVHLCYNYNIIDLSPVVVRILLAHGDYLFFRRVPMCQGSSI